MNGPNMEVLMPSRKRLWPGDVFVVRYPRAEYLFGRVIKVQLPRGQAPMPGCNLIYVYSGTSRIPDPEGRRLSPHDLLIPPSFINRLPWSRGYFQTIESRPLAESDVLDRHCFYWGKRSGRDEFVDDSGAKVAERFEPCGFWGLHSYASLDDEISDALGIGRAPEWE